MLENDKLLLIPIDIEMIDSLLESDEVFYRRFKYINDGGEYLNPHPKYLHEIKERMLSHPEEYPFAADHLIVIKDIQTVIGTIYFKNLPIEGASEIGYGMNPKYEGHGYMSSAVNMMLEYAKSKGLIKVTAEVAKGNIKSQNVLKRNDFIFEKENDNFLWFYKTL